MKYLLIFSTLFLLSCRIYVLENSDLTLSGKYVVSRLEVTSVDQNMSRDSIYTIGQTYINPNLGDPFDTIKINRFYMYFTYATLGFKLLGTTPDGRDIWQYRNIFYNVWFNTAIFSGYLQYDYITPEGSSRRMTFIIEKDGIEFLQLKSSGTWTTGPGGEKQTLTLFLSRVGP
jgi:hypothetical protein